MLVSCAFCSLRHLRALLALIYCCTFTFGTHTLKNKLTEKISREMKFWTWSHSELFFVTESDKFAERKLGRVCHV
jgi:hypothetical protein